MDELDEFMGNIGTEYLSRYEKKYIFRRIASSCVPASSEGRYIKFLEYQLIQLKNNYEDFQLKAIYVDDESHGIHPNYPVYIRGTTNGQPLELGWHAEDVLDPDAAITIKCNGFLVHPDLKGAEDRNSVAKFR
jgi:hypothetical protein